MTAQYPITTEEIIEKFKELGSVPKTAEFYGVNLSMIHRRFKKANFNPRPFMKKRVGNFGYKIPLEQRNKIVDYYKETGSILKTARHFNIHFTSVRNYLEQLHIKRDWAGARDYELDETVFETIDTEEKAYWLGFLSADGSIIKRPNSYAIQLGLAAEDAQHVEKFRQFLKTDKPIHINKINETIILGKKNKCQNSHYIQICSKPMGQNLVDLGVVPNKTYSLQPNMSLPEHLQRHYWRGFVDGDGWISIYLRNSDSKNYKKPYLNFNLGLCGTKAVCEGFQKFLNKHGLGKNTSVKPIQTIWLFQVGGLLLCQAAVSLLYKDATVYLERKYRRAQDVLAYESRTRKPRNLPLHPIFLKYQELANLAAVKVSRL